VVGVVADTVGMELARKPGPILFVPHSQQSSGSGIEIVVRMEPGISPASLAPALRTELAAIDPTMVVPDVTTMQSVIDKQLATPKFLTVVLGIFATLALLLSITGILGVVAYLVRARSYEFGVRMALGASPAKILRLILSYGGRLAAIGIAIGLAGAMALSRLLAFFLTDVQPRDPATMATVPLVVLATVLAACYIPARRAMRIDPVQSLRHD
jgi:putative ABC transport system permease protein